MRTTARLTLALLLWTAPLPAGAAGPEVILQGVRYVPPDITVTVGETVTWVHKDSGLYHHVGADDHSWDSNPTCGFPAGLCMRGGDTYQHTFLSEGTFGYHCRLHGKPGRGMAGVVRVVSG
ncbi:MAG: cupredoxin domain-containing protein [Acidimicrobiia bacterium]